MQSVFGTAVALFFADQSPDLRVHAGRRDGERYEKPIDKNFGGAGSCVGGSVDVAGPDTDNGAWERPFRATPSSHGDGAAAGTSSPSWTATAAGTAAR